MKKLLLCGLFLIFASNSLLAQDQELGKGIFKDTLYIIFPDADKKPALKTVEFLLHIYTVDVKNPRYSFTAWVEETDKYLDKRPDWYIFAVNGVVYLIKHQGDRLLVYDTNGENNTADFVNLEFKYWKSFLYHLVTKYVGNDEIVSVEVPLLNVGIDGIFTTAKLTLVEQATEKGEAIFSYRVNKWFRKMINNDHSGCLKWRPLFFTGNPSMLKSGL